MSDSDKVDLTGMNQSEKGKTVAVPSFKPKLKNRFRNQQGPKRDHEGKFAVSHGTGLNTKKFNWKRALPIIAVIALVGGLMVFRSFARPAHLIDKNRSFTKKESQLTGGEFLKKSNGVDYRNITRASQVFASVTLQELLGTRAVCVNYSLLRDDSRQLADVDVSVSYPAKADGVRVSLSSGSVYSVDDYHRCADLDVNRLITFRDSGVKTATIAVTLRGKRGITTANMDKVAGEIYSVYGLKAQEIASTAPKFGFTWTHENYMVPKSSKSEIANIHMYGWGSLWPFSDAPTSGSDPEADGGHTVRTRIKRAVADGQEVMITACCAPTTYNTTGVKWDLDNSRVRDDKEQQYAQRVAELVERHPEIKYVQVWNEFKGYWDTNAWDAASYTRFYNKVYAAVKAKRSSVLVGGGYVVFNAKESHNNHSYNGAILDRRGVNALQYWLDNAKGFDAIALDAYAQPDDFPKIMSYVRSMRGAKNKPLWWSEFYNRPNLTADFSSAGSPYVVAEKIAPAMKPGDIALYWAEKKYVPNPNKHLW